MTESEFAAEAPMEDADIECLISPPKFPWKTRLTLAIYGYAVRHACRPDGTINRFLVDLLLYKVPPSPKPLNNVTTAHITVDPSRDLWSRLYLPTAPAPATGHPLIVFFHGGGFALFAPNSKPYDDFCRRLASELPAIIVSVNYRLTPEHRFPSQYDDGFDALKFLDSDNFNFPAAGDPKRCFIAGDSAGGNLAHHVAVRAADYEFRRLKVIGMLAIQPFFGGEERTESEKRIVGMPIVSVELNDWMWKALLPEGSDRDHPAVNVFGPRSADISAVKIPATVVFVGGLDPLQDWQKKYYEGLKRVGKEAELVEFPKAIHSFYGFPEFPESSLFITSVRDFIRRQSPK